MGSKNDYPVMKKCELILRKFKVKNDDMDKRNEDEESEDEWDDDNDDGYIPVPMSLKEFLIMETSNIEDLNSIRCLDSFDS